MEMTRRSFIAGSSASLSALYAQTTYAADASAGSVDDPRGFSHHFSQINGIKIHYVEEGKGPLVLLLHGFPYIWYMWRHQIRGLAAAGYRVVAPDFLGYGESDAPADVQSYSIFDAVGDQVGLMQVLHENSAVVGGHDLGSVVANSAVQIRPDLFRALVMFNSPVGARSTVSPICAVSRRARSLEQSYRDALHWRTSREPVESAPVITAASAI